MSPSKFKLLFAHNKETVVEARDDWAHGGTHGGHPPDMTPENNSFRCDMFSLCPLVVFHLLAPYGAITPMGPYTVSYGIDIVVYCVYVV